ncbi:unnamed protein product [Phytophthora fragariaefolia]|uniref:Unnamed protein product n=1 Tax=Phytophthora fragariaefolia TaxID=1490495 RepID=A0A9W6XZS8_9STRA|nr:unnamed protein product [Phytophthora fragariaefolia]
MKLQAQANEGAEPQDADTNTAPMEGRDDSGARPSVVRMIALQRCTLGVSGTCINIDIFNMSKCLGPTILIRFEVLPHLEVSIQM